MKPYQVFAQVYDEAAGEFSFHSKVMEHLDILLNNMKIQPGKMLDVACGTGIILFQMGKKGWEIYGIDLSIEMLKIAVSKAHKRKINAILSNQDMRNFALKVKMDLITSFFDSFNYLLKYNDLIQTFKNVHASLKDNRYFIFDMNIDRSFTKFWANHIYTMKKADFELIYQNDYIPEKKEGVTHLTIYKKKRKLFERFEETHRERNYSISEIDKALKLAGFIIDNKVDFFSGNEVNKESPRVLYICKKP